MWRIFFAFMAIFMACPVAVASHRPLPALIKSSEQIDVQKVSLSLSFDWKAKQAIGEAIYKIQTLVATKELRFETGFLSIQSAKLSNGTPLQFLNETPSDQNGLVIQLDRTYPAKALILLTIQYRTTMHNHSDPNNLGGSVGKGLRFLNRHLRNRTSEDRFGLCLSRVAINIGFLQ